MALNMWICVIQLICGTVLCVNHICAVQNMHRSATPLQIDSRLFSAPSSVCTICLTTLDVSTKSHMIKCLGNIAATVNKFFLISAYFEPAPLSSSSGFSLLLTCSLAQKLCRVCKNIINCNNRTSSLTVFT